LAPARCYLLAKQSLRGRLVDLVGAEKLNIVTESGGKLLLVNQPVPGSSRSEFPRSPVGSGTPQIIDAGAERGNAKPQAIPGPPSAQWVSARFPWEGSKSSD